jgi:hypothetical protein
MTAENAVAVMEIEQRQAAAEIRLRIMELRLKGMTIDEIAAVTPGLVVVSVPDGSNPAPLSQPVDMQLERATITFARQCNCYSVVSGWQRSRTLESGRDVVGIRLNKSVSNNLGGSIRYCNTFGNCTNIGYPPGVDWEAPAGVAHGFSTSSGSHHGAIAFSYKGSLGSVQPYTHYHHAWTTVTITGVGISTTGINVTWQYDESKWNKQTAGNWCGTC